MTQIFILVLNYNGLNLLMKCLPSVEVAAARFPRGGCRVGVIDNASTDDSVTYCRTQHPDVEIFARPHNDFLFSYNPVIAEVDAEWVLLLNNDMAVTEDFLLPLLQHTAATDAFAVTCGIRDWDGRQFTAEFRPYLHTLRCSGSWYSIEYDRPPHEATEVQLASGGASLINRQMFLALGGFDPLFRPGYSEDMDLSIRAWRAGWRIVYEPDSVVHHLGSVSMRKAFGPRLQLISERNRILMVTKLLYPGSALLWFLLLYPKRMMGNALFGNRSLASAMWHALPRLPAALLARWRLRTTRHYEKPPNAGPSRPVHPFEAR